MKPFLIIKTGSTFDEITQSRGDFEQWTANGMGLLPSQWQCVNVSMGELLPDHTLFAGCVITGSHDMVTENADWMLHTSEWIRSAVAAGLPMLGICFGHQLMADALGGRAEYHPDGMEIGTVPVTLKDTAVSDPLFSKLPAVFAAHVTHSQTALQLPPQSVLLAASEHDAHQAFRIGEHAWGVQFHPEFDATATRFYVGMLAGDLTRQGRNVEQIAEGIAETPDSAMVLRLFVSYCIDREG